MDTDQMGQDRRLSWLVCLICVAVYFRAIIALFFLTNQLASPYFYLYNPVLFCVR